MCQYRTEKMLLAMTGGKGLRSLVAVVKGSVEIRIKHRFISS